MSILKSGFLLHGLIELILIVRVMLRSHREPASRIAWIAVIALMPILGIIAYLLFGEVSIGRGRVARRQQVFARMPKLEPPHADGFRTSVPERFHQLFNVGKSINGFDPVGGNAASLMKDSNATIDAVVADIDAARENVHLLFYIWLADYNGCKVVEALKRAATRGVTCRIMADSLGSRAMIKSRHWSDMKAAGIRTGEALRIGNPFIRPLVGRIDLRDHRKIIVIDGKITYCGSQNCADPEFRVKAKYAPWVDAVMRFEGPIVQQCQRLFAADWISTTGEDIDDLLTQMPPEIPAGFYAQAIGTGPTDRNSAMPEMFETLIYAARDELVITTPYYVPDESLQRAICSAAYRGVNTRLIVPARNDSWIVSGTSRSYYRELIDAGVNLFEYEGGLLHTKSVTLDGEVTFIGSANLDRRSFDLNYENNILFYNPELTLIVRQRQMDYQSRSRPVTDAAVAAWPVTRRLVNNTLAMLAPIL